MTPTNKLRFVERKVSEPHFIEGKPDLVKAIRVLQQWWCHQVYDGHRVVHNTSIGEWRDVPLEEEK